MYDSAQCSVNEKQSESEKQSGETERKNRAEKH